MGTKGKMSDFATSENDEDADDGGSSRAVGGVVDEAREAMASAAERARAGVGVQLESQKGRIASQLGGVAEALRGSSL